MRSAQTRWRHNQVVVMAPADGPLGVKPIDKGELGTETEADKHLKRMLDKQLDTKISMKEHFEKHRQFTASSTYTPLAELISGAHSLEEFSKTEKAEEMCDELQRSGLTEEEITLYIAHTTGKDLRKNFIEPSVLKEKMKLIEDKLKNRQENLAKPQVFTGAKTLSRHEMDIEKSLYAGCASRSEFSSLLLNHPSLPDANKCNDAFTYIKDLSEKFTKKCKKRKRGKDDGQNGDHSSDVETSRDTSENVLETDSENSSQFEFDPSIHHVVVPLNPKEVEEQRLTAAEIRQLPKFFGYHPGDPSKVLYLKNLHPKVTVQELIALFGGFDLDDKDSINYRLLTGRMKGQAFVTFTDVRTAEKALDFVNGYLLRGRPIIIEFGKKG